MHRIEGQAVAHARAENWNDVRVLEHRGQMNLAAESVHVDADSEVRKQDFHHDPATQRRVLSHEDPRHATAAELPLERIARAERALELVFKIHDWVSWSPDGHPAARSSHRDNREVSS